MRLKTIHDTYVVLGRHGELLHLSEPSAHDFESVWYKAPPPVLTPGSVEAKVAKGPLARSIFVVLEDGLVAFRRNGLYVCAEPGRPELKFDREQAGVWESFAITTMDGTVLRQTASRSSVLGRGRVNLQSVPAPFRPTLTRSIDDFRNRKSSTFDICEEEYVYAPITSNYEQLKLFQEGARTFYVANFGKSVISKSQINKEQSKYIVTTDKACGVIFDRGGFLNNPGFLHVGAPPTYVLINNNEYNINFSKIDCIAEEGVTAFIFYDGNYFNYYHWWIECLVNIEIAASCLGYLPPAIIWNGMPRLSNWQLESLEIMGVEVIHLTTENTEAVKIKELLWVSNNDISRLPGSLIRQMRRRIMKSIAPSKNKNEKLYIKRKSSRTIKNDVELDFMLINEGYKIIYSEDLSQIEQINLFLNAKCVIGAHGAGMTNILFMTQGASIIELMPSAEVRTFYWLLSEKLRHKYGALICNSIENHIDSPMEVDLLSLSNLMAIMEVHSGFIGAEKPIAFFS